MHDAKVGHILVRKRLLHEIVFDKLQFIGLIGGRVFNPRQQQA